jgi:hypothetical protein
MERTMTKNSPEKIGKYWKVRYLNDNGTRDIFRRETIKSIFIFVIAFQNLFLDDEFHRFDGLSHFHNYDVITVLTTLHWTEKKAGERSIIFCIRNTGTVLEVNDTGTILNFALLDAICHDRKSGSVDPDPAGSKTSVADPGNGSFFTPGSGIRIRDRKNPDEHPGSYFRAHSSKFLSDK